MSRTANFGQGLLVAASLIAVILFGTPHTIQAADSFWTIHDPFFDQAPTKPLEELFSNDPKVVRRAMLHAINQGDSDGQILVWLLAPDGQLRKQALTKAGGGSGEQTATLRVVASHFVTSFVAERVSRLREIQEFSQPNATPFWHTVASEPHIPWSEVPRIPYVARVNLPSSLSNCEIVCSGTDSTAGPESDPAEFPYEQVRLNSTSYLVQHYEGWRDCLKFCAFHGVPENVAEIVIATEGRFVNDDTDSAARMRNQGIEDCAKLIQSLKSQGIPDQVLHQRCRASLVNTHFQRRPDAPRVAWTELPHFLNIVYSFEQFIDIARPVVDPYLQSQSVAQYKLMSADPDEALPELPNAARNASYVECEVIWLLSSLPQVRKAMLSRMIRLKGKDILERHQQIVNRICQEENLRLREVAEVCDEIKWAHKLARWNRAVDYSELSQFVAAGVGPMERSKGLRINYPRNVPVPNTIPSIEYQYATTWNGHQLTDVRHSAAMLPYERVWLPPATYLTAHFEGWRICLELCGRRGFSRDLEQQAEAEYWKTSAPKFRTPRPKEIHQLGIKTGIHDCIAKLRQLQADGMQPPQLRIRCRLSCVGLTPRRRLNAPPPKSDSDNQTALSNLAHSDRARAIERNLGVD